MKKLTNKTYRRQLREIHRLRRDLHRLRRDLQKEEDRKGAMFQHLQEYTDAIERFVAWLQEQHRLSKPKVMARISQELNHASTVNEWQQRRHRSGACSARHCKDTKK